LLPDGVAVGAVVAVAVDRAAVVAVAVARALVVAVAVARARVVAVAVAVARVRVVAVAVAVARGLAVAVGVAVPPSHVPSFRYQLSVVGFHGSGGQSRVAVIAPSVVYLVLL
jgi:hypothetical protein